MNRMNREEFFGKLAGLDEERLRKALWNLYWRGNAALRERIEAELDPGTLKPAAKPAIDPARVLEGVRDLSRRPARAHTSAVTGVCRRRHEASGASRSNGWRTRPRRLWPSRIRARQLPRWNC